MPEPQDVREHPSTSHATLRLSGAENIPPQYVNIIQVSNDLDVFQVTLGRIVAHPFLSEKERTELLESEYFPVETVSRVIVTPRVLAEFVEVLRSQLETYHANVGVSAADSTDGDDAQSE